MNQAVKLINISKQFDPRLHPENFAVHNLNLAIAEGEFFSLLGPSGCGKTTTLRMIAGFEQPTSGELWVYGEPMLNRPPFQRPINTVFQHYALFPHLTVLENVAFGLEMENLPRSQVHQQAMEIIDRVKLSGLVSRYPRQLSGGQQQRVALARALVKQPKVLLLDEPLGALDLKLRKMMQWELKQMQRQTGITFIYVTHDQEEAMTMSDRLGVMSHGQLLQVGTPFEVYEHPTNSFVADFIGESNILRGRVVEQNAQGIAVCVDDLGILQVSSSGRSLSINQIISLAIRPEKIDLMLPDQTPNNSAANIFNGRIKEAIYLGTDTTYQVELTAHGQLTIRCQNDHAQTIHPYTAGTFVQVFLPPGSLWILDN